MAKKQSWTLDVSVWFPDKESAKSALRDFTKIAEIKGGQLSGAARVTESVDSESVLREKSEKALCRLQKRYESVAPISSVEEFILWAEKHVVLM